MLQMVKLKLLDSTGGSLESIDLGTMVTLKNGLNHRKGLVPERTNFVREDMVETNNCESN